LVSTRADALGKGLQEAEEGVEEEAEEEEEEEGDEEEEAPDTAEATRLAQLHRERFQTEIKERSKADGDMFEEMVAHEETIRLGEDGWKDRYYKARRILRRSDQSFLRFGSRQLPKPVVPQQ